MAFLQLRRLVLDGSSPEVMVKAEPSEQGVLARFGPLPEPAQGEAAEDQRLEQELCLPIPKKGKHVMLVRSGPQLLGGSAELAASAVPPT